jgi:hypothetical protein
MLRRIGEALAGIQSLTVAECERVFNCKLHNTRSSGLYLRDYRGTCPELSIEFLEVRFWRTGGIVEARLDKRVQEGWVEELHTLGKIVDSWFINPMPTPTPSSDDAWSYAYIIDGAKIWYSITQVDGIKRLESVSRRFKSY